MIHRFGLNGLYLIDEPEAALSVRGCLALVRRIRDLVEQRSQFIIATHSPILLAVPNARFLHHLFTTDGIMAGTPWTWARSAAAGNASSDVYGRRSPFLTWLRNLAHWAVVRIRRPSVGFLESRIPVTVGA